MILNSPEGSSAMSKGHYYPPVLLVMCRCEFFDVLRTTQLDVEGVVTNGIHRTDALEYICASVFDSRYVTMLDDREPA
jgi:hypothetical protein